MISQKIVNKLKMDDFNRNNPTEGWTDDEKYDFCKIENKWIKKLARCTRGNRKVGVAAAAKDASFSSVEEINIAFENDILRRNENWKLLCHICDYATNSQGNLAKHWTVHRIGERLKCDKCDKDYSHKSSLVKHQRSHTSPSSNKCNQCDKIYKTENSLKRHILDTHLEKIIKCDECEKIFSTIRQLKHHKKSVHVLKSFKCNQCKFRSKTNWELKRHINCVHNGGRAILHKCNLCDYQANSSNLKAHKESVHEKKKNWFCKACPYSTYHKYRVFTAFRLFFS